MGNYTFPDECISEPVTVDGKRQLNKHRPYTEQLLAFCMSVECIGLPWNVTLTTSRPSLYLLLTPTGLSMTIADDAPY